ncbi:MAG TPA: hypothetical protein VJ770_10555, partial [Stellaceae bacterium]|nr:hypothetical protein [Stellaceae bacterium]
GGAIGAAFGRGARIRAEQWLQQQQRRGGILLWVRTPDAEAERRAAAILAQQGGKGVHIINLPYRPPQRRRGVSGQLAWVDKPLGETLTR